ncbi:hypothetical protein [Microbulbifer taiwanensis]|uniref:hypothetical protein n=1 Tax=Microbulbifer taiwanensis TaxID=986746 RepID=UPI0036178B48
MRDFFAGLIAAACLVQSVPALSEDETQLYNPAHSAARNWNEALLAAIRVDYARPTVHARNLFHSSALMYDAWAVYSDTADTYFLGNRVHGYDCALSETQKQALRDSAADIDAARAEAISYGMYWLLRHRFADSPGAAVSRLRFNNMADAQGVDRDFDSRDLSSGSAAALGNYLANCVIEYGLQDGANEADGYANSHYQPLNQPLNPAQPGTPGMADPDRWQPLELDIFVDQAGNETNTPPFLGAEWGRVVPFALTEGDRSVYERDGQTYHVYHDPGAPALLQGDGALPDEYRWGHTLVALWSSHLDPGDGVMIDISPASVGNTTALPLDLPGLRDFYRTLDGGSTDRGGT